MIGPRHSAARGLPCRRRGGSALRAPGFRIVWVALFHGLASIAGFSGGADAVDGPTPDRRQPVGPFLNHHLPAVAPGGAGAWTVVDAFPHLRFEDPTFLTHEPRSNRLVVCGRQGLVYRFDNNRDCRQAEVFLDVRSRNQGWHDCGLLQIAFHPEFGNPGSVNRGYFFVWYQFTENPEPGPGAPAREAPGRYNRLSRFTVPDGAPIADPNSELVLVQQHDRHIFHNGGAMFFGSDGFLYFSNGDEGGMFDPFRAAQVLDRALFSGVFRIDVDRDPKRSHPIRRQPASGDGVHRSFTANYFIPNDNPFQDPAGGVLEEYWALGLRNPDTMTLDPVTGWIWIGDVGQQLREEINLLVKGGNYQWSYREGFGPGPRPKPAGLIGAERSPLFDYPHADGDNCVIGGFVYRGSIHRDALEGKFLFGDNGSGRIWALDYNGVNPPSIEYLCRMPPGSGWTGFSNFGRDAAGEVYLCMMGTRGRIYTLDRAREVDVTLPDTLSRTGAFAALHPLTPEPGLIPYKPSVPVWADGARSRHWIAVPNDGTSFDSATESIGFHPDQAWRFPVGTVFIKHLELPPVRGSGSGDGDGGSGAAPTPIETQLLALTDAGGVYGLSYRWRSDGSDADLVRGGSETVSLPFPASEVLDRGEFPWTFLESRECQLCHNHVAGPILGVRTAQWNLEENGQNQILRFARMGMFGDQTAWTDDPSDWPRLTRTREPTASAESRVRSYLDANCAHCHRPGGVRAEFDARIRTALRSQNLIGGPVTNPIDVSPDSEEPVLVHPGRVHASVLYQRLTATDHFRMPPLGSHQVNPHLVRVLTGWINSMTGPDDSDDSDAE